jgi:hypothetical protein
VAASPLCSQRQRQSRANEDSSVEGASDVGNGGMGVLPCGKRPWYRRSSSTERAAKRRRRDRERQRSRFAARAREDNAQRGSCPALTGQGQPLRGEASTMIAAGARGTPIRGTIRGRVRRQKRLAGVNVDGVAPKLTQTVRVAKQGRKTVAEPAQAGSRPENWRFHRVPV